MHKLEIRELTKRFAGVAAIDGLSIAIEAGRITSVIGPNGSGKSTLVNVLSGLLSIDGGAVTIGANPPLKKIKPCKVPSYGITRTFQEVRLFEQMTVLDNILVVLTERNLWGAFFERHKAHHMKQAGEALNRTGLWGRRDDLAVNLSYGQRKLLEVARALAMCATG